MYYSFTHASALLLLSIASIISWLRNVLYFLMIDPGKLCVCAVCAVSSLSTYVMHISMVTQDEDTLYFIVRSMAGSGNT